MMENLYVSDKKPDIHDRETRFGYTCFFLSNSAGASLTISIERQPLCFLPAHMQAACYLETMPRA